MSESTTELDEVSPSTHDSVEDRRSRPRGPDDRVLTISELEEVRLLLRGGSVVDWYRMNFTSAAEVHQFMRLLEVDPTNPADLAGMERLRRDAALYLVEELGYRLPDDVLGCPPLDLFLYASAMRGRRKDRFFACMLLKVIHIVHHIRARELLYRLPLSQSELAQLLIRKVTSFADSLIADGFPLSAYSGSEKPERSRVTKLLVKKEHHAAAIRDRIRFRFIVENESDLVPLLNRMTRGLLPFNYIVPGQTLNQLVNFTALMESHQAYRERVADLQIELGHEEQSLMLHNEFSGPDYRMINFVADVPLRVPDEVFAGDPDFEDYDPIIFGLAEFQVVDAATDRINESGENRHDRYRDRQLVRVRARLERGLRGGGGNHGDH